MGACVGGREGAVEGRACEHGAPFVPEKDTYFYQSIFHTCVLGQAVAPTVGGPTGAAVLGTRVGARLGATVGSLEGEGVGALKGRGVGATLGAIVGRVEGAGVGGGVGARLGVTVGSCEGDAVGTRLGAIVGSLEGEGVGERLGAVVGRLEGEGVGALVGRRVGVSVGDRVGASVHTPSQERPQQIRDVSGAITSPRQKVCSCMLSHDSPTGGCYRGLCRGCTHRTRQAGRTSSQMHLFHS